MKCYSVLFILLLAVLSCNGKSKKQNTPPHCTQVTKDTDYLSRFRYDYPIAYIQPGQREAYQQLFCVNPPTVNKAVTTVCDWAAPPQVQFTLGDEYMHVVRQDPTGRYIGNAVITTYQLCNHNLVNVTTSVVISTFIGQNETSRQIMFYEYGEHVEGEILSFQTTGYIEPFTAVFVQNVTPERQDVEQRYTYLRLEYVSPMSKVEIDFDAKKLLLTFHVRFPIFTVVYGIVGYSLKISRKSHVWNEWDE